MKYEGKHALVLGLGESGLAMARWLARCGAAVRVADTRAEPARLPVLRESVPHAEFVAGNFGASLLEGIDFVAVSPGLAPTKELAEITPAAQAREIPLWGEIELFAQALAALKTKPAEQTEQIEQTGQVEQVEQTEQTEPVEQTEQTEQTEQSELVEQTEKTEPTAPAEPAGQSTGYAPKVIAITGTNGKTTVTSLTGLLCRRAGLKTQIAGNISPAALDVLREALDANDLPQAWVLELSSFQLHSTFSLQADAATVLNVTQDHLDWHGDMAAYAADKARIFGAHTVRVLNRDDAEVMRMGSPLGQTVSFGRDEPEQAGCFGLVNENGMQWLAMAVPAEEGEKKKRKKDSTEIPAVLVNRLMPAEALKIRGQHNAMNALAALALCREVGLPLAPLLHGLREYHGEPHRVELIANVGGVDYYDDSKGTNVGATVAALNGLGAARGGNARHLILIAGGDGKGQSFAPLAEPVAKYARAVLLIGTDGPAIRAVLEASDVELVDCATLQEAVRVAADRAQGGDEVLLSPACASFDMFDNYAHRAQVFNEAVRELALDRGEIA